MKNCLWLAVAALAAMVVAIAFPLVLPAGAAGETPWLLIPGGGWWGPKGIISVNQKLDLQAETRLEADEVRVNAPIVTNGHPLFIYARKLVFGSGGRIGTFESAAPAGLEVPPFTGAAPSGGEWGLAGADGANGKTGNPGMNGVGTSGTLPGEIHLFAATLQGEPVIDGKGQDGGKGGKGGAGQKGGSGGPGIPAHAADPCWFGSSRDAGTGGKGGKFGPGGAGGVGGRGGAPVPIALLLAWGESDSLAFPKIVSAPGSGGPRGEAGDPGAAGEPGTGGAGNSASCWFFGIKRNVKDPGPDGPKGQACFCAGNPDCLCPNGDAACALVKCTRGTGKDGAPGALPNPADVRRALKRSELVATRVFRKFERQRYETSLAWFEFHWARLFEMLADGSLALLDDGKISPKEAAAVTAEDPLTDLDTLVDGSIQEENLKEVKRKWKSQFLAPLKLQQARLSGADRSAAERISWALTTARSFDEVLTGFERKGVNASSLEPLRAVLAAIKERRRATAGQAAAKCRAYVTSVLQSPVFKTYLQGSQYHFDIPACLEAGQFIADAMRPIELVREISLLVSGSAVGKVLEEKEVATKEASLFPGKRALVALREWLLPQAMAGDFDPRFRIVLLDRVHAPRSAIRQAHPKLADPARLSRIGVLRGYLVPSATQIDLAGLGEQLYGLTLSVGGER